MPPRSQAARIGEQLRKQIANAAIMLTLEIDKQLRLATPVDTGHARANWVPSVGSPHGTEESGESGHADGVARVLAFKLTDGVLWVSNATPYIHRLNYGHSKQAPAGFVERAVDVAFQNVKQRLARHNRDTSALGAMRAEYQSQVGGDAAGNLASVYNPLGGDS